MSALLAYQYGRLHIAPLGSCSVPYPHHNGRAFVTTELSEGLDLKEHDTESARDKFGYGFIFLDWIDFLENQWDRLLQLQEYEESQGVIEHATWCRDVQLDWSTGRAKLPVLPRPLQSREIWCRNTRQCGFSL